MSDDFAMMFERRAVNDIMADLTPMDPEETSGAMEQMESTPLTEDQLKAWPPFAAHSKNLYALYEGEAFRGTDDEAAVYGIETMGEFAHNFAGNEGTLHQAAQIAMSKSSDYAKSFVYLAKQYERLPTFSMKGFGRFVGGILRDPLTYAGLGVGAMGFKAIGQPAKAGIRGAITELAKKAALAPKTSAAISGGTLVGGGNVAQQSIEAEAGMEKPMAERATEAVLSTALGAAAGAGMVKGGELAVRGGKSLYEKVSSALDGIDVTPDDRAVIDDVIKSLDPAQQPPAQQAAPIEPRGPAVKLTPAENKFFASFMENKANREELMEEVPSLRIDNGTISVDQKGVDELFRWIDETVVLDGAGKVPPRLKKAKFYNMLDGETN